MIHPIKPLLRTLLTGAFAAAMALPSAFAAYPSKVNADLLNVRNAPNGEIVSKLPNGSIVNVINNSDSKWFLVSYADDKEGYVSSEFLTTLLEEATEDPEKAASGVGYVKCDTVLNLRKQPNKQATVLSSIRNGQSVTLLDTSTDWFYVNYNGQLGYVHSDYITLNNPLADVVAAIDPEQEALLPEQGKLTYEGQSQTRIALLELAAQLLGTPYVYGGSTPGGFDCSGFTSYLYANTVGTIPRVAQDQFDATTRVAMEDLIPGDLVFFGSSDSSISHVGMYVGGDQFIHAPNTGGVVRYESLSDTYGKRFRGGGRVIFNATA